MFKVQTLYLQDIFSSSSLLFMTPFPMSMDLINPKTQLYITDKTCDCEKNASSSSTYSKGLRGLGLSSPHMDLEPTADFSKIYTAIGFVEPMMYKWPKLEWLSIIAGKG